MLHYTGLILIIFTWLTGFYLVVIKRDTQLKTISRHASRSLSRRLVFAVSMTCMGLLFYWWLVYWLKPELGLTYIFTILVGATTACQIATGLFPDTSGWVRRVHRSCAYSMAILFMPVALLITTAPNILLLTRVLCGLCSSYMIGTFLLVVVLRKVHSHYLLFQVLYIVAFELAILFAAYLPKPV